MYLVTLQTISLISKGSPFVSMTGAMDVFDALTFFLGIGPSGTRARFNCCEVVSRSMHSSARSMSSAPYPVDILRPSSASSIGVVVVSTIYTTATTLAVICYVAASAAAFSWHLFSASSFFL